MVERGREKAARQFDWSVVVDRHEQLFHRHLAPRVSAAASRSRPVGDVSPLPAAVRPLGLGKLPPQA